ncbi:hypothetical protein [Nocardia rhamnosiphila]
MLHERLVVPGDGAPYGLGAVLTRRVVRPLFPYVFARVSDVAARDLTARAA